jgi:hypothetical protein
MTRRSDSRGYPRPGSNSSADHDIALLAAMAELPDDPVERERVLQTRLDRWRDHPLCGPRAAMPDRYPGPEPLDTAAFRELVGLISRDAEHAAVLRALDSAADVVDIGGGTGLLARSLAERCPVTVVEPSAEQRACLPAGLTALDGRAEAIPLRDGSADAALAAWVLQYTANPITAIDEMERVARRRIAIVLGAPTNDLIAIYNRAAELAGHPRTHHGFVLAHVALRLELAGFRVSLESIPIPVRPPPGGAPAFADLLARLHFAGHPASSAIIAATGGYIDARLAEAGMLADDAILLVGRR